MPEPLTRFAAESQPRFGQAVFGYGLIANETCSGASSKNSGRGYERKYETYEIPVPSVKESAREQHITGLVTLVLIVRLQLRPKNAGYLPEAEFFEKTVGGVVVYSRFEIAVGDSLFAERVEGRSHQQAARTPGPVPR